MNPTCSTGLGKRASLLQFFLHARPALASRFFRSAGAAPVSFKTRSEFVALLLESAELPSPIDCAASHGSPFLSVTGGLLLDVLTVDMPDAILRQLVISIRESILAAHCGVAWIPVDHEVWRFHGGEQSSRLRSGCRVARILVFKNQDDVLLGRLFGGLSHFVVNCRAIGRLILQPPEIEDPDTVG